ncbi:MAG: hypothetical protein K0U98_08655 [Deltaproteobacteria bacterium]|nr:hypothetical protein [Deltaproteobacteria bacterium]
MSILRMVLAIIAGYLLFAVASMSLLVPVMGREGLVVIVLALAVLAIIGVTSGYLAKVIAGGKSKLACSILAALVALATLANLVFQTGAEPVWYKIGTLVLTASMILLVGSRQR